MASLLLAIIYLSFISLGLPDSLLGSAWPVMRLEFGASLSFAGVVSMIISGGTIVSSLLSDRMTQRLGAGRVTAASVAMTAAALFGFSTCRAAWMLCLWAIPYGLGAGGVDAALNNYVALHYSGRHNELVARLLGCGRVNQSLHHERLSGSRQQLARRLSHGIADPVCADSGTLFLASALEKAGRQPGEKSRDCTNRPSRDAENPRCALCADRLFLLLCPRIDRRPVGKQLSGRAPGNWRRYSRRLCFALLPGHYLRTIYQRLCLRPSGGSDVDPYRDCRDAVRDGGHDAACLRRHRPRFAGCLSSAWAARRSIPPSSMRLRSFSARKIHRR